MRKLYSLLTITSFLLVSCSHMDIERTIANDPVSPEISEHIDRLLTFRKSEQVLSEIDLKNDFFMKLAMVNATTRTKFEFIEDAALERDVNFKLEVKVTDLKYKVVIHHAAGAFKDHNSTIELLNFFINIGYGKFVTPYSMYELIYNANTGHAGSLLAMAKLRQTSLERATQIHNLPAVKSADSFNAYVASEKPKWDPEIQDLKRLEKQENAEKKILLNKRKEVMSALDNAADENQFRAFVARGDRQGAADIIEAYLPWEEMAPFEKRFWKMHLHVMRTPVPLNEKVLMFRGIEDDVIHAPVIDGRKLTKAEALEEQNIFLLSTVLTKNQGSWNRRLRSLTTMNDKFMGSNDGVTEYTKNARITHMLIQHARSPDGSPFLSMTPSFNVAKDFAHGKMSAYFIDPRLLHFNFTSSVKSEMEHLVPLVTFPDEMAAVHFGGYAPGQRILNENAFSDLILKNLQKKLGSTEGAITYKQITENTRDFLGMSADVSVTSDVVASDIIANDPKAAAKRKNMPAGKPVEQCKDLLKLFW